MHKLIRFRTERAVKRALKHATAVVSCMHFVGLKILRMMLRHDAFPRCEDTITLFPLSHFMHLRLAAVTVPRRQVVAAERGLQCCDMRLHAARTQAVSSFVFSVTFHASAPYLATGSEDVTTKLWL